MRATTEFLLRESLALLLDDPTPRNVAHSMGGAHERDALAALALESQSQTEDESESQGFAAVASTTPRVMMVRATDSSQQLLTLVDRSFSIDAFLPQTLIDALCAVQRMKTIARLRGTVVRIDKYHFATPAQCRATQPGVQQFLSVSTRHARRENTKLWLFVDALVVIDDNDLVVNEMPELETHAAVAKQLAALPQDALAQRLALRQGLAVVAAVAPLQATPSPAKRFDDFNPLLDEDCEIPEDQERELDAQEGWGDHDELLAQPTDSQLIAENGPVSGESQPASSGHTIGGSSSSTTVVASSSDAPSPAQRIVVSETEPQSQGRKEEEGSVPDSQEFHFERVNLKKAFVDCSDTDSDNDEYEMAGSTRSATPRKSPQKRKTAKSPASAQRTPKKRSATTPDSQATESQSFPTPEADSQQPLTQATGLSGCSLPLPDASAPDHATPVELQASQAPGEFMGVVHADHDEPMTQMGGDDESQVTARSVKAWSTQAQEPASSLEIPSDPETIDVEYELGNQEEEGDAETQDLEDEERGDRPAASQQDGQADHWMETQPSLHGSPARPVRQSRSLPSPSPRDTPNSAQSRKRRRSPVATPSSEPTAKAARLASVPSASTATASISRTSAILGISSFNKTASDAQLQRLRPSKRFKHLLPPFDLDAVLRLIREKKADL